MATTAAFVEQDHPLSIMGTKLVVYHNLRTSQRPADILERIRLAKDIAAQANLLVAEAEKARADQMKALGLDVAA